MSELNNENPQAASQVEQLVRSSCLDSLFSSRPFSIMDYFIREKEAETRKWLCNSESPPSAVLIEQNVDSIFYSLVRRWSDVKKEITKCLETHLRDSGDGDLCHPE